MDVWCNTIVFITILKLYINTNIIFCVYLCLSRAELAFCSLN